MAKQQIDASTITNTQQHTKGTTLTAAGMKAKIFDVGGVIFAGRHITDIKDVPTDTEIESHYAELQRQRENHAKELINR